MAHFRPVQSFAGEALRDQRLHIAPETDLRAETLELKGHF
jgi:hypothetical protein